MKKLIFLSLAAMTILTFGGASQADAEYVRRPGYQNYHYAPHSYRRYDRDYYNRGYRGPSRGYYRYGNRHYGQRTLYFNFFGLPIVTY